MGALDKIMLSLEWWVLDWNETAIGFYKRIGAKAMDDWTVYRVTDQALDNLAASWESSSSGDAKSIERKT